MLEGDGLADAVTAVAAVAHEGDMVLTLGAGICMVAQPGIAVFVFGIFFGVQLLFHGGHMLRVGLRMKRLMP